MKGLRVLVVDDEPLALAMVVALAAADPDVGDVHESGNPVDALAVAMHITPDIVLLDVDMPEMDGIELAERLSVSGPVVVFVTAHRRYAADAFEVGAIDYLLKPFSDGRFREALGRAKRRVAERRLFDQSAQAAPTSPTAGTLAFGEVTVTLSDVFWIEAQDYYVRIHTADTRHLVRITLTSLEDRLPQETFLRVHRAAIVNLAAVRHHLEVEGTLRLVLANGAQVPVSRARRRIVQERVGSGR